jgi:hypothetical protein
MADRLDPFGRFLLYTPSPLPVRLFFSHAEYAIDLVHAANNNNTFTRSVVL